MAASTVLSHSTSQAGLTGAAGIAAVDAPEEAGTGGAGVGVKVALGAQAASSKTNYKPDTKSCAFFITVLPFIFNTTTSHLSS